MNEQSPVARPTARVGVFATDAGRAWLWVSLAIGALGIAGSIVGLVFEDSVYGRETANWAAQAVGQDVANLIAFPVLVIAAVLAARGSIRAYLVWLGLLVYSAYTYAIYAFALHFGPLFLGWVAILGLSTYSLIVGVASVDASAVQVVHRGEKATRFAARLLIAIGATFSLLWLMEIVPAIATGTTPEALEEVGLLTNPVHVLDLAILLPALVTSGLLLSRGRPLGYLLAPVMLTSTFFLALGILSLMIVSQVRDLESATGVGLAVAVMAALELSALLSLLRRIPSSVRSNLEGSDDRH